MLNIVCINAGDYLGRGVEYTNILFDMVRRNLSKKTSFNFICFTDSLGDYTCGIKIKSLPVSGLKDWWNKISLFKDGIFPKGDRVLYLDLDTVVISGLDDIIKYKGDFAILRDFYRPYGLQSSVMAWEAGKQSHIWNKWINSGKPEKIGGDQEWIELVFYGEEKLHIDRWQDLYPGCFVSYKINAINMPPKGTKMVIFHGNPRPHEIIKGWVPKLWKIGGGSVLEFETVRNVTDQFIVDNIRYSLKLPYPWIQPIDAHESHAVLVGGAPSMKKYLNEIKERQKHGQIIFALNNTYNYLLKNGIKADCHVMLDAREENKEFVPKEKSDNLICYYSSQCHKQIFDKSKNNVILWHAFENGILDIIGKDTGDALIGGGHSVGMRVIALAHTLGYRKFHLYGYDSSYSDNEHHAYKQTLNDGQKIIEVEMNGKKYQTAAWMCTQVEDFKENARILTEEGCTMTVHGEGLLPDVANLLATPDVPDTEMIEIDGIWWPSKDKITRQYHAMTFHDIGYLLEQCGNGIAVQAGGNVGLWPKEMAKHFREVHTFEPDALNYECLLKNCPEDNILAYPYALGEKHQTATLERASYNCGAHFIKEGDEFSIVRIDDLELSECDLIQLDIEGYELKALKGAKKIIEKSHPVIMVEDKGLSNKYGSLMGDLGKWLEQFGYKVHSSTHRDIIFIANEKKIPYNLQELNVNRGSHV